MAEARARLLASAVAICALALGGCSCDAGEVEGAGASSRTALELAAESPDVLARVAPFRFTASDGRTVTAQDLEGSVWVVDFFFTTCSGPCPVITGQMRKLQEELAGSDVRLVSITVDPATDDVAALRDYAARVGADPARWWFLTGDEAATYALIQSSFALPVERHAGAQLGFQVSHATRLVVVDRKGGVRGYYPGEDAEGRALARERALWLARHPGS